MSIFGARVPSAANFFQAYADFSSLAFRPMVTDLQSPSAASWMSDRPSKAMYSSGQDEL